MNYTFHPASPFYSEPYCPCHYYNAVQLKLYDLNATIQVQTQELLCLLFLKTSSERDETLTK